MHSARITNSPRLQRVLDTLKTGPKTTREIVLLADVCAVNTIIDELRDNGITVNCRCLKKGVYQYSLAGEAAPCC